MSDNVRNARNERRRIMSRARREFTESVGEGGPSLDTVLDFFGQPHTPKGVSGYRNLTQKELSEALEPHQEQWRLGNRETITVADAVFQDEYLDRDVRALALAAVLDCDDPEVVDPNTDQVERGFVLRERNPNITARWLRDNHEELDRFYRALNDDLTYLSWTARVDAVEDFIVWYASDGPNFDAEDALSVVERYDDAGVLDLDIPNEKKDAWVSLTDEYRDDENEEREIAMMRELMERSRLYNADPDDPETRSLIDDLVSVPHTRHSAEVVMDVLQSEGDTTVAGMRKTLNKYGTDGLRWVSDTRVPHDKREGHPKRVRELLDAGLDEDIARFAVVQNYAGSKRITPKDVRDTLNTARTQDLPDELTLSMLFGNDAEKMNREERQSFSRAVRGE